MAEEADDRSTRSASSRSSDTDLLSELEALTLDEFAIVEEVVGGNRVHNAASTQRIHVLRKADVVDEILTLFECGGLSGSCRGCKLIAQVINQGFINEAEVQRAHDAVLNALSRHGPHEELSASAAVALAETCSRLHRGVAAATKAALLGLQRNQLSVHVLISTLKFFDILIHAFRHRMSEVFDDNGSEAFVLAMRLTAELSEAPNTLILRDFCRLLALALPATTLGDSLTEAGLIDVLMDISKKFRAVEDPGLSLASFSALDCCVQQWPLTADVLVQNDILDIIAAGLHKTGDSIPFGLVIAAWKLFLSITTYVDLTLEQLEAILRLSVPWLDLRAARHAAVDLPVDFFNASVQVLIRCCIGSNEMRELAGRLNAVQYVVHLMANTHEHSDLKDSVLHALMELLHFKANRDLRECSGGTILQHVVKAMANGVSFPALYERGFSILLLLAQEGLYKPRFMNVLRQDKMFGEECTAAAVGFFRLARHVGDYPELAQLAYEALISVFADIDLDKDDALRRAWVRVLHVLHPTMHLHLEGNRVDLLRLLPLALHLITLATPRGCLEVDKQALLDVMAVTAQSLKTLPASLQNAGCSALVALIKCAPHSFCDEVAEVLRDNGVAELLSSAICEPTKDKALLASVAQALSSTVDALALASARCDDASRPRICESIVPAVFLLLQSAEFHDSSTRLLDALCQYSHEYRIQLATKEVIRALVAPLLSSSAVKHAAETYRVLRLLTESDDACVTHALDAGLLKVKGGKCSSDDRVKVEARLRMRRDADNADATASSNAAFAELMAEEEAAAAAKRAAQQKRSSKSKKKAPPAAPAAPAADDSPAPAEPVPEAEPAADETAAPSSAAGLPPAAAGGSEADSLQKPRKKTSRGGSGRSRKQLGITGDTDSGEAQQLDATGTRADTDALSAAGSDSQLEGFLPVETRKKGLRKQPAAEAATPSSSAPAPPTQPRQRQRQQREPPPQQQQPAAPQQPRPVPQSPPPVALVMHPLPLPSPPLPPPLPTPMLPPQSFVQPPPAHAAPLPLMPWQKPHAARPDAARADAVADPSYSLFSQLPPPMLPLQEPRVPQQYRPPAQPVSSSVLPPALPSIFPPLNEQMAQVAITPQPDAAGAGLSNAAGEYNCFLNSIVQALFHVRCFRTHLLRSSLPNHAPNLAVQRSIALVSALGDLFCALQSGVVLRRSDLDPGATAPGEPQGAVAPTALRQALAALNASGGEAAMNTMADAAEVLSALYDAFQSVSSAAATRRAVDETPIARMFGFGVREAAVCTAPGCRRKVTHELSFRSFFHIVFSTALRDAHTAAAAQGLRLSFEELLAQLQAGDVKRCDKDVGGCGAAARVRHDLEAPPTVFTISLAWDAAQAAEDVVAATMKALRPELRPELVFDNPPRQEATGLYELRAMVCYYGSHYAAYARTDDPDARSYLPSKPEWSRFDDASVTRVGNWDAMCDACARGHLQPTVLFYEKLPQLF